MRKIVTLIGAGVLFATSGFAAFDAETVAFYPFTDKDVGVRAATGDSLTNAVSELYPAKVKLFGSNPTQHPGSLTFEAFPFPYVYSDSTRTNLLTSEAQAIHVQSSPQSARACAAGPKIAAAPD